MAQNPVRFVCPACGQDSSGFVNELVQRELGVSATSTPPPPPPVAPAAPSLRVSLAAAPPAPVKIAQDESPSCAKHPGVHATDRCGVCLHPMCPQCVERFGLFCSVACKNQAARAKAAQKSAAEAKFWRKTGLLFGSGFAMVALAVVGVVWYAFFGSMPHPVFSTRFDQKSHSGAAQLVGKDQLVYLHGGTLGRGDLKTEKIVWSLALVTPAQIAGEIKREDDLIAHENEGGRFGQTMTASRREKSVRLELEGALSLRVAGQNIWVGHGDRLTHYDWDSGKVLREIAVPEAGGELVQVGDELQLRGEQFVTHISLASGEARTEEFRDPRALALVGTAKAATGGLPLGGSTSNGPPLDPAKVAAQAQNLKLPAKIALPALLANAQHEQQLEAALQDEPTPPRSSGAGRGSKAGEMFRLVPGPNGFVQFSRRMMAEHLVTRSAMQAAPKKSALDGQVNAAKTGEIANEILNEMQRNRGGDVVTEDESRYQVTVHLPGTVPAADWMGEVVGPPQLFPLKTVNVVAGGKSVFVLDQANKKLWQAALTYPIAGGGEGESQFGAGPCVEHGDTLYVFDQAVLAAFDLTTGNARWRLPSIGVVGLFFDDAGMLYVNTTTGNPDDIRYSRQVDINKSTAAVLLKLDPKNGKTLWRVQPGGFVSYLAGKFIYTVESYDPGDQEDELSDALDMLQKPALMHLTRLNPKNGRTLWDYSEDRAPVAVQFHDNTIELVFKKEVEVLKYLSF